MEGLELGLEGGAVLQPPPPTALALPSGALGEEEVPSSVTQAWAPVPSLHGDAQSSVA